MISRLIEAADARRTVLTPSAELAAALFDAVERAYRESGREVWPTPRVRDFGGWLKEQHVRGQLGDSSTPRCLSEVEERELWRRAVLESKHVLIAPGVSFNVPYRNCFRITNLPEPQVLGTVFTRIEELLEARASGAPALQVVGSGA